MNVVIPIPLAEDDIRSNCVRLGVLIEELKELATLFEDRIDELLAERRQKRTEWVRAGLPEPSFSFEQLTDEWIDVRANLYFKCYLFVARQLMDRILRLLFQLKGILEPPNPRYALGDASRGNKFAGFIRDLCDDRYQYDPDVLNFLKENRDFLIITRLLRNSLKVQGTFRVIIVDNKDVTIICSHRLCDRQDSTIDYLKRPFSAPRERLNGIFLDVPWIRAHLSVFAQMAELVNRKAAPALRPTA
jgi:hypothetical protein